MRCFIIVMITILYCTGFAQAQVKPLQTDFTFKRITPKKPGQKTKWVQVTPDSDKEKKAADSSVEPKADAPKGKALPALWFWSAVGTQLSQKSSDRLDVALTALSAAKAKDKPRQPRLTQLREISDRYGLDILRETVQTNVSPALVLAIILTESAGQADAVSRAGAEGLMQLMPATAERFGVTNRAHPQQNIKGGVAYLAWLLKHFDNDPILVIAAYNAGEGSIRDHKGVPPYRETRAYVPKVLAAWQVARGLCLTPPTLVTDGCVFLPSDGTKVTPQ